MPSPRHDVPPPLEGNDQLIAAVGTVAWAIALLVVVLVRAHIPSPGHWIWTCAVGVGLGLFGMAYVPRLKRSRARAALRQASTQEMSPHESEGR